MAKNSVIAGDYIGKTISNISNVVQIFMEKNEYILLDKYSIENYDLITEDVRKSITSGIVRGSVGSALLGPVGLLAGLSAKNTGVYVIAIRFKDGKNSLIEVDQKVYQSFIKGMF